MPERPLRVEPLLVLVTALFSGACCIYIPPVRNAASIDVLRHAPAGAAVPAAAP